MERLAGSKCIVCGSVFSGLGAMSSIGDMTVCCCDVHAESVEYEIKEYFDTVRRALGGRENT